MFTNLTGSWVRFETGPIHRGQGKTEDRGRSLHVGRCRFSKKGNSHMRFVLDGHKMSTSLCPPARILKVYTETLTELRHIYCLDGLNNTSLSQGYFLENDSHCGKSDQYIHSKDRKGSEEL